MKKYVIEPDDDHVVAWPVGHTRPDTFRDKRDIEFTVRATLLKKSKKPKKPKATSVKDTEAAPKSDKEAETKTASEPETKTKDEL